MIKRTKTFGRIRLIDKYDDRRLKGKYLEKGTLTVVQLQEIARVHEAAQWQVKNMEQNSGPGLDSGGEPVGAVSGRNPNKTLSGSTHVFSLWKGRTLCKGSEVPCQRKEV